MSNVKLPAGQARDLVLLLGWIFGLIFVAALCWFFTQPLRNNFLLNAVNRALEQSGDSRRLKELSSATISSGVPVAAETEKSGFPGFGVWYSLAEFPEGASRSAETSSGAETSSALVFTFIGGGFFFPCIAVLSPEGKVEEFIALNSHGERLLSQISPGILKLYTRRIEGAKL